MGRLSLISYKFMKSLFVAMALAMCASHAIASPINGIVPVSSQYLDEQSGKISTVTGAGTLFFTYTGAAGTITGLYLVTAAHVSNGNKGHLTVNGQDVSKVVLGRLADVRADIELIELPLHYNGLEAVGVWAPSARRVFAAMDRLREALNNQFVEATRAGTIYSKAVVGIPRWGINGTPLAAAPASINDDPIENESGSMNALFNHANFSGIGRLDLTGEKFSIMHVVPGMSGEVLWDKAPCPGGDEGTPANGICYEISGITTRYLRDLTGSYFASDSQLANLIENYQASRAKNKTVPQLTGFDRWKMANCLLYRAYSDGSMEINPSSLTSGGHMSGDGGGHLSGDGGGHMSGDGGDVCADVDPGVMLEKLPGGMTWIDAQHPRGAPAYGILYSGFGTLSADASTRLAADLLAKSPDCPKPTIVGDQADFVQLLIEKLHQSVTGTNAELDPQNGTLKLYSFLLEEQARKRGTANLILNRNYISFAINFKLSERMPPESIRFMLNRHGQLVDPGGRVLEPFTGSIQVTGNRGGRYSVNLQSLFFTEPSSSQETDSFLITRRAPLLPTPKCENLKQMGVEGPLLRVSLAGSGKYALYPMSLTKSQL